MATTTPWQAAEDLALVLRQSTIVQAQSKALLAPPTMVNMAAQGFAGIRARVPSAFSRQPLFLATALNMARSIAKDVLVEPAIADAAARIELATRNIMTWVRSQLPGYPMLLVPHLVPNSPYTSSEFTWHASWDLGSLQRGDQFANGPRDLGALLGLQHVKKLDEHVRAVASALSQTTEWARWTSARNTANDRIVRDEIAQARRSLREALSDAKTDAFEPRLLLPRNDYREQQLRDLVDSLSADARELCDSFTAVDSLINMCITDVLAYLTLFGKPRLVQSVEKVEIEAGQNPNVRFETTWPMLETGDLWFLDDSLIDDCVLIHGVSYSFDQSESRTTISGTRLDQSWGLGSSLA